MNGMIHAIARMNKPLRIISTRTLKNNDINFLSTLYLYQTYIRLVMFLLVRTTLYFRSDRPKIACKVFPSIMLSLEMLNITHSKCSTRISLRQYPIIPRNVCSCLFVKVLHTTLPLGSISFWSYQPIYLHTMILKESADLQHAV